MTSRNNRSLFARFYAHEINARAIAPQETREEAEMALIPFLKKGSRSIVIYGLGLGYHYDALKSWLSSANEHQLVFIEEDLATLQFFLDSNRAEMLLTDPQVHIIVELNDESTPFLANLTSDFYFLAMPKYQNKAESLYAELLSRVYSIQAYLSDLWLYKEQANFYRHLSSLDEYRSSKGLEKHFNHLPVIICGAGPSLQEEMPQLKKTKAVLAAAGTGMNLLNQAGIEADLGIIFDPKPSGSRRMQSNSAFTTPYIVDIDSIGAEYVNGPKVLTWQKTEAKWKHRLLEKLGIKNQLLMVNPAISSTHYALELAIQLGFTEQVLVGVDLAYVEGRQYPGKKTWLSDADAVRNDQLNVKTEDQRIVTVSTTYFKEALIYADLALKHPEIRFYNASTKGQTIHGMRPIQDLTYLRSKKNIKEAILAQNFFNVSLEEVRKVLKFWKDDLQDVLVEYQKRLELKFEAKKRYLKAMKRQSHEIEQEKQQFYQKVTDFHSKAICEALMEMDEKKENKPDEIPYKEGKLEGKVKLYYTNGALKSESDFVQGKREGIYRFYSRSGQLLEEGHYKAGIPVGEYTKWNRDGEVEKKIKCEEDLL